MLVIHDILETGCADESFFFKNDVSGFNVGERLSFIFHKNPVEPKVKDLDKYAFYSSCLDLSLRGVLSTKAAHPNTLTCLREGC